MRRCFPLLALPLGLLAALAISACGSGGSKHSAATLPPLSAPTQASVPTTTATTVATATQTTTAPSTTPTTTTRTTTHASGGAAPQQTTGGAPAGCPAAVGGFIRDVRATDCGVAGTVANAWFAAVHAGARPDGAIQADGYTCTGTMAGEQASVSCSGSGGSVAFTASP